MNENIATSGNVSGSYNALKITNETIIREAYERIGITSEELSNNQLISALNSCNLILINWLNKGLRQWMIRSSMEAVVQNQQQYLLLDGGGNQTISDIRDCVLRTQLRLAVYIPSTYADTSSTTGVPFSSSGDASNCFNYYSSTPVSITGSTTLNASIGFNFNVSGSSTSSVTLIGINSSVSTNYTLRVETSSDNTNWTTLTTYASRLYPKDTIIWQPIFGGTTLQYLRIVETSGVSLNINQLYFSNVVTDIYMTRISRDVYLSLSNKQSCNSQPNQYFFDRQISPALYLYPYPSTINQTVTTGTITYQNQWILLINYTQSLYDIGGLYNLPEIPPRFFESMIAELSYRLAIKNGKTEMLQFLAADAENSFNLAKIEDTESTPVKISSYGGDWSGLYY